MSKRIKRPIIKRVVVSLFALVAAALLAAAGAAPGTSARIQEHDIYYFTDATYTTQCGYKVFSCERTTVQSGCVTQYTEDEWFDCFSGNHSAAQRR
jgi:hypothetical protein